MLLREIWDCLEADVFPLESTDRLFNQYRNRHPDLDLPDAPRIRRINLRTYFEAYVEPPPVFLLAEAPGPWGCRFSGVPITSEAQLLDADFPIHGARTSTAEAPHTEYSANIHWRMLAPYFPHFLTWNTVPFHPHRTTDPLSIRTPTNREIDRFAPVIDVFLRAVEPRFVVAVGRKAERALNHLGVDSIYVRHPSQGGAGRFREGMAAVLEAAGVRTAGAGDGKQGTGDGRKNWGR